MPDLMGGTIAGIADALVAEIDHYTTEGNVERRLLRLRDRRWDDTSQGHAHLVSSALHCLPHSRSVFRLSIRRSAVIEKDGVEHPSIRPDPIAPSILIGARMSVSDARILVQEQYEMAMEQYDLYRDVEFKGVNIIQDGLNPKLLRRREGASAMLDALEPTGRDVVLDCQQNFHSVQINGSMPEALVIPWRWRYENSMELPPHLDISAQPFPSLQRR